MYNVCYSGFEYGEVRYPVSKAPFDVPSFPSVFYISVEISYAFAAFESDVTGSCGDKTPVPVDRFCSSAFSS